MFSDLVRAVLEMNRAFGFDESASMLNMPPISAEPACAKRRQDEPEYYGADNERLPKLEGRSQGHV